MEKGNHADLLKEALGRHMEEQTCSGINNMWLEEQNKFLNALDGVAPMVSFRRRNNFHQLNHFSTPVEERKH